MSKNITLGEFIIENQSSFQYSSGELSKLLNGIRLAAKMVTHEVNKAVLIDLSLQIEPTEIHQRVPFFCGSTEMVEKLESFL